MIVKIIPQICNALSCMLSHFILTATPDSMGTGDVYLTYTSIVIEGGRT